MGAGGSVVARLVEMTTTRLVELGCEEAALRARVSFPLPSPGAASGLHRRVPYAWMCELVEVGAELTGDPGLGLRLSLPLEPRAGGLLVLLMLACPDVRAALRRLERYQRLAFDAHRVSLDGPRLRVSFPGGERPATAHLQAWFVEDTLRGIGTLSGVRPAPLRVTLSRALAHDRLARAFGCPIDVGTGGATITFDEATLRRPLRHANAVFREGLEHEVSRLAARLPRGRRWAGRVRATLLDELVHDPTLSTVATRLGVAPRTLQRRLAAEGTSVASILDDVRRDRAIAWLDDGHGIAEVSFRLGYASPTSFHRAFRRWFGVTPTERRALA